MVQLVAGILVVLVAVTIGGSLAARRLAEREAVNDAAQIADVLAETVVQPALTDALLAGDAGRPADSSTQLVRDRVLGDNVVRVKIWSPEGKVLYADQPELVGRTFPLEPEEREVLEDPRTVAEISDLDRAENALDRDIGDKLVEVYRPVWTAPGQEALFEIYAPYDQVSAAHRPAVARVRRRDPEQPAAVRGAARPAGVAPALARTAGPAPARAAAAAGRGRLGRGATADRRDPARRTGAGPRRHLVRDRRGHRARRVHGPARTGRGAARRRRVGAHQHPRAAHPAGRHLPAEPRAGRARRWR